MYRRDQPIKKISTPRSKKRRVGGYSSRSQGGPDRDQDPGYRTLYEAGKLGADAPPLAPIHAPSTPTRPPEGRVVDLRALERDLARSADQVRASWGRRKGDTHRAEPAPRSSRPAELDPGPGWLPPFVAIDFETANSARASACAVAVVRVEPRGGKAVVTGRWSTLLRPAPLHFDPRNSRIHGIHRRDVVDAPAFWQAYPQLFQWMVGAGFVVAHNAPFDRSVLAACCQHMGVMPPNLPWLCTVKLSRKLFGKGCARLPEVADRFGLPLDHHDPASDALACAGVLMGIAERRGDLVSEALREVTVAA
jgi:DNA polymerase-3 subunit epsilon